MGQRCTRAQGVAGVLIACAVGLLASCSTSTPSGPAGSAGRPPLTGSDLPSSAGTQSSARARSVVPVASGVQLMFVLGQTRQSANGIPIVGELILTNDSPVPIVVSNACDGWFFVGLVGPEGSSIPGEGGVGCRNGLLPKGVTTYPVKFFTTYTSCTSSGPADPPRTPLCVGPKHESLPNLPPGVYTTALLPVGLTVTLPKPPPITVTLTGSNH